MFSHAHHKMSGMLEALEFLICIEQVFDVVLQCLIVFFFSPDEEG